MDAIAAYSRAAQLDPAHAAAFRELGLLHRDARQAEAASTSLQRYLELAPNAPDRGIVEAFVREEQARLEAAR